MSRKKKKTLKERIDIE